MRVRFDGRERVGRALDVPVPPERAMRAIRADGGVVDCPDPRPVHDHVGLVAPDRAAPERVTLAAVARSLGHEASRADRLAALDAELERIDPPSVDLPTARERVATTGEEVARLRERVATLRGRVEARREVGADPGETEAAFRDAARRLSEAETERQAAAQALARARERAREARDLRERRLSLTDERDNLAREARAELAGRVRERVDAAVAAVPGNAETSFAAADPVSATLGAARVADLRAPVVLATRRFPDPRRAARWLDAPVLRVSPRAPPPRAGRGTSSGG